MTVFFPDVSNNSWGSTDLTIQGRQNLMQFLASLPGEFAALEHKMSEGSGYADPYGKIAQDWCQRNKFPFIGYHFATTDDDADQVSNWLGAGGGNNVMLDFEQVDGNESPMLDEGKFWSLVDALNSAEVNVALAYVPQWYADGIGMDLTPLSGNGISLISSAYPLGYSEGSPQDIYRGCGGDSGEGWASYRGGLPSIWQYTSSAKIDSLNRVDCNAYHGTRAMLSNLFGMMPISGTTPH